MSNVSQVKTQVEALIERNIIVRKLECEPSVGDEQLIEAEEWAKLSAAVKYLEERYKRKLS